jgi:hypothetical protein
VVAVPGSGRKAVSFKTPIEPLGRGVVGNTPGHWFIIRCGGYENHLPGVLARGRTLKPTKIPALIEKFGRAAVEGRREHFAGGGAAARRGGSSADACPEVLPRLNVAGLGVPVRAHPDVEIL